MIAPPPALALSDRLALIIAGLWRALAARCETDRPVAPILALAGLRLHELAARFAALVASLRAGRLPAPPAPRWVRDTLRLPPLPALPNPYRLPRRFGWLVRLAPEAEAYGEQVQDLLADPEMAALLAGSPQASRILRPLCRMLGIRVQADAGGPGPGSPVLPAANAASGRAADVRTPLVAGVDPLGDPPTHPPPALPTLA